jgi:Kef-type K+ transport system membrane component KefB
VLEDLVLYIVLAIAIGYAGAQAGALFGLPNELGIAGGSNDDLAYHVLATVAFLAVSLLLGPTAYRWIGGLRMNLIQRASPIGHQLTFMFLLTIAALGLGIEAFFGALVAGIVVGSTEAEPSEATMAVTSFALAFFIPIYFAMIGLGLDLVHGFSAVFFVGFLVAACAIKAASVYAGARMVGETGRSSLNLAVAMNARGGPGIVVASTAFAAGIIGQPFYAVLVLLAIVTSLAAGAWLDRVPRDELLVRPGGAPAEAALEAVATAV